MSPAVIISYEAILAQYPGAQAFLPSGSATEPSVMQRRRISRKRRIHMVEDATSPSGSRTPTSSTPSSSRSVAQRGAPASSSSSPEAGAPGPVVIPGMFLFAEDGAYRPAADVAGAVSPVDAGDPLPVVDAGDPLPAAEPALGRPPPAYKTLWTRMWRRRKGIRDRAPSSRTEEEALFLKLPGPLMTLARLEVFAKLLPDDDEGIPEIKEVEAWIKKESESDTKRRGRPRMKEQKDHRWATGPCIFVTYNGPWGVFTGRADINGNVDYIAQQISVRPDFRELAEDMRKMVRRLEDEFPGAIQWAYAFELCPESLTRGVVRIHAHVCVATKYGVGQGKKRGSHVPAKHRWAFRGSLPVLSSPVMGQVSPRAMHTMGFFYLLVRKVGAVWKEGNCRLFKDLLVNPDWAFQLLQQGKITTATAHDTIVRCAKNVPNNLANLTGYTRQVTTQAEATTLEEAAQSLTSTAKPFRALPEVEQWRRAYGVAARRYKFLVLEGPSLLGKTAFAESLAGYARTLNIDCASATEPDMREYISTDHEVIIFDEAKAALVLRCKRLFQAPACRVHLGQSNTNCHAYTVMVWQKKFVVCSNTWSADLAACSKEDREWLQANSVHVLVTAPLWQVG